jgi:hypothetical protein
MTSRLEQILILQDLDLMIREMSDQKTATQLRKIGFEIGAGEAGKLTAARAEIAAQIDKDDLNAYERLMRRYPRAVVPVRNGVCLACFIKQPTQLTAADLEKIRFCEQCKRILYAI